MVGAMTDKLSERYQDLLTGNYDCVDRVVLNAYFPVGHSRGGFRMWWRLTLTAHPSPPTMRETASLP